MATKKKASASKKPAVAAPGSMPSGTPQSTVVDGRTITAPAGFGIPAAPPPPLPPPPTDIQSVSKEAAAAAESTAAMGGGLSDQLVVLFPELKAARDFFLAQNYTAAQNALKQTNFYKNNSPAAIANLQLKLDRPGVYQKELNNYINTVKRYAAQSGFTVDNTTLSNIAEKAFALGYDANSQEARNLFDVNFTADKVKGGNALLNLTAIKNAALANGYSDAQYQANIPGYLERLKNGEDPQAIQQEIRNTASLGYAEPVKKLMQSGTDLSAIVRPYKDIMYSTLELNPETIQLSDPRLTQALSGEKEMTLSDFQRSLRKDPTWQYTNNARQEAASVASRVLRDFGFQG